MATIHVRVRGSREFKDLELDSVKTAMYFAKDAAEALGYDPGEYWLLCKSFSPLGLDVDNAVVLEDEATMVNYAGDVLWLMKGKTHGGLYGGT